MLHLGRLASVVFVFCAVLGLAPGFCREVPVSESPNAAGAATVEILLLGDSTVEGSITRELEPDADQIEDIVRKLLDGEGDLPPLRVVNQGKGGEFVHGLLENRYNEVAEDVKQADFVTIRYGLNDYGKRENFKENFVADLLKLIGRIREANPDAEIVLETVIVYFDPEKSNEVNDLVRKAAEEADVPLVDQYARMEKELAAGNTALTYHRVKAEVAPEKYRFLLPELVKGEIRIMDNRLDVHLREVPGWFSDKHPNLAGYHIIGSELARFLAPRIRARAGEAGSE